MFWAAVLPFQITFVALAVGWAAFVYVAPRLNLARWRAALLGAGLSVLGFIPLCLGVMAVTWPLRFGEFHYETAADASDYHIREGVPDAARDLTVHLDPSSNGFVAHYAISRADLDAWLDAEWADRRGETLAFPRPEPHPAFAAGGRWGDELDRFGRPAPADAVMLDGPHSQSGAGSNYYHSEIEGRAYQRAGYW